MHSTLAIGIESRALIYLVAPTTKKHLCLILGHAGYYRRFIQKYALTIAPIKTSLTWTVRFSLDNECQDTFSLVISYQGSKPVLGEDAQKMQMIDPSIADRPSTQGMRKLAIGMVTIGKKKNLLLKGAAFGH